MNILTRWPVLPAARGAAVFGTLLRTKRYKERKAHKAELHEWENEGGNLAPSPKVPDTLDA
jgi:hypothetical protein